MHTNILLRRIKILTWFFIISLVLSGATAIPLITEVDALAKAFDAKPSTTIGHWLLNVQASLHAVKDQYPFLFYGTDWLAFGHFAIAIAFIGALRDPVRNQWLFTFGMISCILVIPYAFIFGAVRGIPVWWRLIDCSFGLFGIIPLVLCKCWAAKLEDSEEA